ncbi:unnamed protein product [Orchesella dallaii]|uniref:Uncharacterized protein n=1 Tax=Orchesella dallaii TaxID=48710 RepID=A0ABP1S8Y0_9HEXA
MEESERKLIRENLTELINLTTCNTRLLARLEERGVLGKDDVDKLGHPGKTSSEKAKELYDVIVTRTNGFKSLLDALEETKQSGAFNVLTSGREPSINEINELTYNKTKILGRGSYGYVCRGKLGSRVVAVKILLLNLPEETQQVLDEGKILQHCDAHENVVRYFGTKQVGDIILIVLELCDTSLREWVSNKEAERNISPVEVLNQATAGLAWLHSKEIIHRDLKPENILLILTLKKVKLSDFGLSRRVMDGNSFVATRNIGGTAGWMAPEILSCMAEENQNMCQFTYASDVFSLGCVYYYVLTDGKCAFGDAVRCQANILDGKSMMTNEHMKYGCSQNILLINTMISPDPKSRPNCKSLLDLPLFWSENKRVAFLEKTIEKVSKQLANFNARGSCNFDHSGEIKVLEKMGYESTRCRCIVAFLFVECSKRGISISNISEEEHVVMESKKETVIKPKMAMDKSGGTPTSSAGEVKAVEKSPVLNVVKHPDSVGVSPSAAQHKVTTSSVNRLSVSKKQFENQLENTEKVTPAEQKKIGNIVDELKRLDFTLNTNQDRLFEIIEYEDLDVIKQVFEFVSGQMDITEIWKEEKRVVRATTGFRDETVTVQISLLHVAERSRGYDVVEYLVNDQAFGNVLDKPIFQNILVLDCIRNINNIDTEKFNEKCRIIQLLSSKCPNLLEFKDNYKRTPLHNAMGMEFSNGKQIEFINTLLQANAFVNAADSNGRTPLHMLVYCNVSENVIEITRLLIAHGADINVKENNNYGMTFLHLAAMHVPPHIFHEIILYLVSIQREKSFVIPANDGCTVLHFAMGNIKGVPLESTLQLLKIHGVNFNALTNNGDSVMSKAIVGGRSESFLNTLILLGADWTIKNKKNDTALHHAANKKNLSALKMFIGLNCDVNSKNVDGETPLHKAINTMRPLYDVINELVISGADPSLQNNKRRSPIHIAKDKFTLHKIDQRTLDLFVKGSSVK